LIKNSIKIKGDSLIMNKKIKWLLSIVFIPIALFLVVSIFMPHHKSLIEVTRETTATREQIWKQWADVPNRKNWDTSIEYATIDGPFQTGSTGEVKLSGQPVSKYEIIYCKELEGFTDRFSLPLFAKMDFIHTIKPSENGLDVTFRVELKGPFIFVYAGMVEKTLKAELPAAVEKLISLAKEN
jgi:hypothetical protein